jgi:hypothetical protein
LGTVRVLVLEKFDSSGATVKLNVLELFPGVGSVTPAGAAIDAVLEKLPAAVAVTPILTTPKA